MAVLHLTGNHRRCRRLFSRTRLLRPGQKRNTDRANQQERTHTPAENSQQIRGVTLIGGCHKLNYALNQGVAQNQRGHDSQQNHPDLANLNGGVAVQVLSQSRQCTHHVCNHDNGAQASSQNTEEVYEVIENIQHVQTGGSRHQQ